MIKNAQGSGQPIFRATSALDQGQLKSKGGAKLFIQTIFRTVVSANQLSIHGAVAHLCEVFGNSLFCAEKIYQIQEQTESMVKSADLLNCQRLLPTNDQAQGDLL